MVKQKQFIGQNGDFSFFTFFFDLIFIFLANFNQVEFLDGSYKDFAATVKTSGEDFLKTVAHELNLLETDYFGISFRDGEDNLCWIDSAKSFKDQGIKIDARQQLRFGVKENEVKIF